MTFSVEVKTEIAQNDSYIGCCTASHLYGLLLFAKGFSARRVVVSSEHGSIVRHAQHLMFELGINLDVMVLSHTARSHSLTITDTATLERLMHDFGYTGDEPSLRINLQNLMCDNCLPAFVAGCFMTGGNITDPQKNYHLEFATYKSNLFTDMKGVLEQAGFPPRATTRGYAKVLYYKNSGQIEDLLTYMGAVSASLSLMDTKIYKEIVNTVNRRTNCESANIDKIVDSAARDRLAIESIYHQKGKDYLPDDLRDTARLRLEYPELPLAELGGMLEPPLTKSGVSHRLRRIRQLAEPLKEQPHEH